MSCFWSDYESKTWEPLPMAEDYPNHVSRKISGRNVMTTTVDLDYGRCNHNSGRQHFNQRPQQPLNNAFARASSMEFVKAGASRLPASRYLSSQGDGRCNDRFGRGIVGDINRLSLSNSQHHVVLENCFEQLRMAEKFRLEVSITPDDVRNKINVTLSEGG